MTRDILSNVAYPVCGGAAFLYLTLPTEHVWAADVVFALLMLAQGVTSWYYHAGGKDGNHWDVGTMYTLGLYIWLVTIGPEPSWWSVPLVLGTIALAARWLRMKQLSVPMENKIGGLFFVVYGTALLFTGLNEWVMASVGVILLALLVRSRAHWGWHLLSAPALALLWIGVRLWQASLPPLF